MLLCVIFLCSVNISGVYAFDNEQIEFFYQDKVFVYNLLDNVKTSTQFDLDYEINKYNRFGTKQDRLALFNKILSIGIDKKIAINYLYPNLQNKIEKVKRTVNIKAKNAELKLNTATEKVFNINPEIVGQQVDEEKLYTLLCNKILNKDKLTVVVPIKTIIPKVVKQDFLGFTNLRGDFSTDISSSSGDRKHNIKNAMHALNKIEILPKEIFSFNKIVGRRTAENGYRTAKIIVNNEFVEGVGGGVCQVSSTLYNAALLSGLEIVEANKHSKQVGYVKYGFDAMVNFGSSDLKFKNNTGQKLTIITNYTSNKIRIRIFGENLGDVKYKLKNEISNVVQPTEEIVHDIGFEHVDKVEYDDEYFYLKKSNVGMDIISYREKYVSGNLSKTEILRKDTYKVQNALKIYGTKKREQIDNEKNRN